MEKTYAKVLVTNRPPKRQAASTLRLRKCEVDLRCIVNWLMHRDEQLERHLKRGVLRIQSKRFVPYIPSASMLVPDMSPIHDKWYSQAAVLIQANPYAEVNKDCQSDPRLAGALAKLRKDTLMLMAARDFLGHEFPPSSTIQGRIVIGSVELLIHIQLDGFDIDTQTAYVVQTREQGLSSAENIKAQMILHVSKIPVQILVYTPGELESFALRPVAPVPNLCANILRDFAKTL